MMKYNELSTTNHQLVQDCPACLQSFDEIILKDDDSLSSKPNFFDNVNVINLDDVEIAVAKKDRRLQNKTMDVTFVVSNNTKKEMLLVELRFNYTNLKNLKQTELKGKIEGSIHLLPNDFINEKYIFIFKPDVAPIARHRLARMNPRPPQNYEVMDLDKLKETYF